MNALRRIWLEVRRGENIDLYVTILVSCCVVVLGLVGVVSQSVILPIILAVLAILVTNSLKSRSYFEELGAKVGQIEMDSERLFSSLSELMSRIGTPPEIIFEPVKLRTGKFYLRLIDCIEQVSDGDEIYVLARYSTPYRDHVSGEEFERIRQEYSEALLRKARERNVVYRRIICFDEESGRIASDYVGQWLVDHSREMLQIAKKKPGKVFLKKGRVVIGPELFIIKGRIGVIAIDVRDVETDLPYMAGGIIFHNPPNGELIDQLTDLFMMVDNQSVPVERVPEA